MQVSGLGAYQAEAAFALLAVREAALLCAEIQREAVRRLDKQDRSPVTAADFASQATVAWRLAEAFPDDPLVAEEGAEDLRRPEGAPVLEMVTAYLRRLFPEATAEEACAWIDRGLGRPEGRFWALDPIDGTKGFLRGDQYAVALALLEAGRVVVAALGCPALGLDLQPGTGSLWLAVRGAGAWALSMDGRERRRVQVSQEQDPRRARLLRSFEAAHTDADLVARVAERLGSQAAPVRMDSQAKYAVLAGGGGELMLRLLSPKRPDYREKIWDQAAGSLLVKEAGGRVSDLRGEPLDFTAGRELRNNVGVVASNGHLHEAALRALAEVGAVPSGEA